MDDTERALRSYASAKLMLEGLRLVKKGLEDVFIANDGMMGAESEYVEFLKAMRMIEDRINGILYEADDDEQEETDGP